MSDLARLQKLKQIADLIRDRDIATLKRVQDHKMGTEALLRALDQTQTSSNLVLATNGQVVERYGLWTTNRRIALNQQLARETAACMSAHDTARTAFGRAEVLKSLLVRK